MSCWRLLWRPNRCRLTIRCGCTSVKIASLEPLSLGRERELLTAIQRGDETARHKLTEFSLWEVVRLARPFIGRGISFLDLVQEGNLGLIRAVSEVPLDQESFGERRDARVREAIERVFR